jgi:hypothetical protein
MVPARLPEDFCEGAVYEAANECELAIPLRMSAGLWHTPFAQPAITARSLKSTKYARSSTAPTALKTDQRRR